MAATIKTTSDSEPSFFSALVVGSSGVGKTVACSTLPKPVFIMADAGGIESVRSMNRVVDFVEIDGYGAALDALSTISTRLGESAKNGRRQWDSLVVDSLSTIEDNVKLQLIGKGGDFVRHKNDCALSLEGWGVLGTRLLVLRREALSIGRKHGIHVVFTALPANKEINGVVTTTADLSGKQGERTPGDVMVVANLRAEKLKGVVRRTFSVGAGGATGAKDRFNKLSDSEPANFRVILTKCGFAIPEDDLLPPLLAVPVEIVT